MAGSVRSSRFKLRVNKALRGIGIGRGVGWGALFKATTLPKSDEGDADWHTKYFILLLFFVDC